MNLMCFVVTRKNGRCDFTTHIWFKCTRTQTFPRKLNLELLPWQKGSQSIITDFPVSHRSWRKRIFWRVMLLWRWFLIVSIFFLSWGSSSSLDADAEFPISENYHDPMECSPSKKQLPERVQCAIHRLLNCHKRILLSDNKYRKSKASKKQQKRVNKGTLSLYYLQGVDG